MKFITTISDRDTWFFRSSTWFNRIYVNGLSGNDGAIYLNGVNLYGTLSSNANLISGLQSLSGNWEDTYTIMMQNSADWISAYTTVLANSASWEESTDISYLSGRIDSNTNDITNIGLISANWNSTYTTVNTNSSTTWLGDTAVDSLVHSNSANWNTSYYNISNLIPYSGATNDVDLGSHNLTISGNVGIGTSTPNKRLTIVGDISAQGTATIISSSFGTIFRAGDVSNTGFAIATDPSENLYAIGQTNISAPSGSCIFYADGYDHSAMQFRTRSSTGGSRICRFRNITDSLKLESLNDSGTTVTSSPATFSLKAPSNSFYITSAGNILLGKTTDDGINKLQVNGNIIASNLSGVNTGDQDLSTINSQITTMGSVSANWISTYTTVLANSALWDVVPDLTPYATLSGANFTGPISTINISISSHIGYDHPKKIVLLDEDGEPVSLYLRGGILTID